MQNECGGIPNLTLKKLQFPFATIALQVNHGVLVLPGAHHVFETVVKKLNKTNPYM